MRRRWLAFMAPMALKALMALTAFAALLTMSGCVQLPPASPPPQAHVPRPQPQPQPEPEPQPGLSWWRLVDPQLQQLLALADAQALDVAKATARLAQVRAQTAGVEAAARPQLALQSSLERTRSARREPGSDVDEQGRLRFNRLGLEATATWSPDPFGRNAASLASALAVEAAAQLDLVGTQGSVRAALIQAYLQWAQAQAQAQLAQQLLRLAQAEQHSAAMRAGAGLGQPAELEEAQLAVLTQQQAARDATHAGALAQQQLALLTGQEPGQLQLKPVPEGFLQSPPVATSADPVRVLARRADVQAAWQRWQAAHQDSQLARLERFPKITLSASGGWTSDTLRRFLREDSNSWLLGLRASVPLLDAGRIRAAAAQAQAQSDGEGLAYRSRVLEALQQVATHLVRHEQACEQAQLAAQSLQALSHTLDRQQRAHLAGRVAAQQVRQAETRWLSQAPAHRAAQAECLKALVLLQQASGELS